MSIFSHYKIHFSLGFGFLQSSRSSFSSSKKTSHLRVQLSLASRPLFASPSHSLFCCSVDCPFPILLRSCGSSPLWYLSSDVLLLLSIFTAIPLPLYSCSINPSASSSFHHHHQWYRKNTVHHWYLARSLPADDRPIDCLSFFLFPSLSNSMQFCLIDSPFDSILFTAASSKSLTFHSPSAVFRMQSFGPL